MSTTEHTASRHHSGERSRHKHRRHKNYASDFKRRQLRAIERQKKFKKFLFVLLCITAIIMAIAVAFTYSVE